MSPKEELQLELAETYNQLANIAQRQRALARERIEVETNRDNIIKELGRIAL